MKEFGYYSETEIPIVTKANVKGCDKIILKNDQRDFIFIGNTATLLVIKPISKQLRKQKSVFSSYASRIRNDFCAKWQFRP